MSRAISIANKKGMKPRVKGDPKALVRQTLDRKAGGMSSKLKTGIAVAVATAFVWSYWPTVRDLVAFWQANEDYSSGQFVPLVGTYVLWSRRRELARTELTSCWAGFALLVAAQGLRFYGVYDMYGSLERYSVVLGAIGLAWFMLGTAFVLRFKWVLLFLFLTMPFPGRIHTAFSLPLQEFATSSAVFGLEMLGQLVVREGNVLRICDQSSVAVAEACNGLRMLNAFIVVCAALAFVIRRPLWQKAFVVASSVVIAILCNTLRLIVTVLLFKYLGSETAERFFHDFAGLMMMPLAIVIVVGELKLLDWLTAEPAVAVKTRQHSSEKPAFRRVKLKHALKH